MRFFPLLIFSLIWLTAGASHDISEDNHILQYQGQDVVDLSDFIDVLEDTDGKLTIKDVSSGRFDSLFVSISEGEGVHFGFSESIYWLRFKVKNITNEHVPLILEICNSTIDRLQFFKKHYSFIYTSQETGDALPYSTREIKNRNFAFPLELFPNETYHYYIRINSNGDALNIPVFLNTNEFFSYKLSRENIIYGIFYGILFAAIFTTAFFLIALELRRRIYINYIFYLIFLGLFTLVFDGLAFQMFFPNLPSWNNFLLPVMPLISVVFLLLFTMNYFDIRKNLPLMNKIFLGLIYLNIAVLVVSILGIFGQTIFVLVVILALLSAFTAFLLSFHFIRFMPQLALIYMISFLLFLVSALIFSSSMISGALDVEVRDYALKIGLSIQVITLTGGLAYRVKMIQEGLYRQSMNAMEQKVRERTEELNHRTSKLQGALNEINLINRQISDQKMQLEEANQKIRETSGMKEIFLANTSHEIRTPLNAIIGYTNLLMLYVRRNPGHEKLQSYLSNIKTSGDQLLVLINDILDFSKIEAGKLELECVPFSLNENIQHVISTFNVKAAERSISLKFNTDPAIPPILMGDPYRLTQIIGNLVSNAVKFTGNLGEIELRTELITIKDGVFMVLLAVKDSGIGISPEKQSRIFDSFSQAESHTTRKFGGTGLGLAIVKRLAELQGGSIELSSAPGLGSEFRITIPYKKGTELPNEETGRGYDYTLYECHPEKIRVLLAEDNEINQEIAIDTLGDWTDRITVDTAENGKKCIELLNANTYDLVLMDIQMPEMDGYEATMRIRNDLPDPLCFIPIIAMTANAMEQERNKCLSMGMNEYISKPFTPEDLFYKIKTFSCSVAKERWMSGEILKLSDISCQHERQNSIPVESVEEETKEEKPDVIAQINLVHLEKVYKGNKEKINRILGLYIETIPVEIKQMRVLMAGGKFQETGSVAHTMKTKMLYLGLSELNERAKAIEGACKEGVNTNQIPQLIEEIELGWEIASLQISDIIKD
ncbi:MAG: response regulator [Bacteroidetes bacterium]|nr:response regulator [Bacteroidota bacterium]MBU1717654.1 response regulator [Bacteroidota bacterium]